MDKNYDYLIVGSGLFGATFAYMAKKAGKTCLVLEKRNHIGGNIYTSKKDGIDVHDYGAHIFHTSNKAVWDFVTKFAEFNNFVNSPIATFGDETYNLPLNMNTFSKMWNIKTPSEAKSIIENQIAELDIVEPNNLEEQVLKLVGRDIYEKLIKDYLEKRFLKPCAELPAYIIKTLPIHYTYDNNYYEDRYQGIPIGGYFNIVNKMLFGVDVMLSTDYETFIETNKNIAKKVIFTGMIDSFYKYCYGALEYSALRFEMETLDIENYQDNAVVLFTSKDIPYTRIFEHKHFEFGKQPTTVITKEYCVNWEKGDEPYYPINNEHNNELYARYAELAAKNLDVIFAGRLGDYKYYDMDKTIENALLLAKKELSSE